MKHKLRERCKALKIEDTDWYIAAYMRCSARLDTEERRGNSENITLLQRRLQALFDKISADFEEESTRQQRERAVAIGINHAVTDRKLPRTLLKAYERQPKKAANDNR